MNKSKFIAISVFVNIIVLLIFITIANRNFDYTLFWCGVVGIYNTICSLKIGNKTWHELK